MVNAMAFAHFVDAYADEMGNHYATHSATPARVFVTSSELRNVTAPRMSAACPLNSKLFALVAAGGDGRA